MVKSHRATFNLLETLDEVMPKESTSMPKINKINIVSLFAAQNYPQGHEPKLRRRRIAVAVCILATLEDPMKRNQQ